MSETPPITHHYADLGAVLMVPMPVLAMDGAVSFPHGRGRGSEVEQSLRRVAVDVRGEVVSECGHFVPEEAPELLADRLLSFFGSEREG